MADSTENDTQYIADFISDSAKITIPRDRSVYAANSITTDTRSVDLDNVSLQVGIDNSRKPNTYQPSLYESAQTSTSGHRSDFYNAAITASYMLAQYKVTRESAERRPPRYLASAQGGTHTRYMPNQLARGSNIIESNTAVHTPAAAAGAMSYNSLSHRLVDVAPSRDNVRDTNPHVPMSAARLNSNPFSDKTWMELTRAAHSPNDPFDEQHVRTRPAYETQENHLGTIFQNSRHSRSFTPAQSLASHLSGLSVAAPEPVGSSKKVDHGIPTADMVARSVNRNLGLAIGPIHTNTFGDSHTNVHSKSALKKLLDKSVRFIQMTGCRMYETPFFYRDKTVKYFNDIILTNNGLMEPYSKDFHGDPKSPINGVLNGLFFSVNIDKFTGRLPTSSIYGDRRLLMSPSRMLNICPNFYFTDFYCVNQPHYVTLVMTRSGSPADSFCQKYLIPLTWNDNPIFQVKNMDGTPSFFVRHGIWVEVMFTEDINLNDELSIGASWTQVIMKGNRSGGRRGLRKDASCTTCNL